ncbi:hypothetical protein VFPPC_02766 [Pochonia chlamydosporia 170]|uniref:Uncharacterized protein n=1 Tax=Pochonia chlamydosporia 170 TaxID=1380566 RepID=A0A179FX60_METCM|nr:hypothetical protein VFPPC_02766 [Pochonia chlamydosporia 170]OAQ70266.1 hypothetical protein VFPPC_02766 [Pochonia chlamydosporia 170]
MSADTRRNATRGPLACIETNLTGQHLDIFVQASLNILDTSIARETYSQIIDGLPLASVAGDSASSRLPNDHPLYEEHVQLCPGVKENVQEMSCNFYPLISEYRAASPGSRAFKTRLIEMAAEAIHELAVLLFNAGTSLHADGRIASWVPPKDHVFWEINPEGAWPTVFYHHWYANHEEYPNGVADMVGYWAEARIFGGVVLFDRRNPDEDLAADPNAIWFHSDRAEVTYRIYQLLEEQKGKLLEFLTSDTPDLTILPILGNEHNLNREDPEEPVGRTGIYRHLTDRKPLDRDEFDGRLRDVWTRFEYPTQADFMRAQERAYDRQEQIYKNYGAENT